MEVFPPEADQPTAEGKAARGFLGIPVERSDNTGTAMLFEGILLEQNARVQQPPKIRETFAVTQILPFVPKGESAL